MALVICDVLPIDLIRLRMSRVLCIGLFPRLLEGIQGGFQLI
jgi:hypothetical protein